MGCPVNGYLKRGSDGWNAEKAYALLTTLRANHKTGTGPQTMKETRELADTARKIAEAEEQEQAAIDAQAATDNQTLSSVFYDQYLPQAKQDSWLVENGTDLYYIKELMGHSTIALTERYAHTGDNALRAAVQRLEAIG